MVIRLRPCMNIDHPPPMSTPSSPQRPTLLIEAQAAFCVLVCKRCPADRRKPDVLLPGIVGMRGSIPYGLKTTAMRAHDYPPALNTQPQQLTGSFLFRCPVARIRIDPRCRIPGTWYMVYEYRTGATSKRSLPSSVPKSPRWIA